EPGLGAELARRQPDYPRLFDYEIEIAFTVLEDGSLGWMLANDLTVRTVQVLGEDRGGVLSRLGVRPTRSGHRLDYWGASKSFPSTLLLGRTMIVDELRPDLELVLRVNGEVRQRGRTTEIAYSAAEMRRLAGPIEPADVVLTGTPGG